MQNIWWPLAGVMINFRGKTWLNSIPIRLSIARNGLNKFDLLLDCFDLFIWRYLDECAINVPSFEMSIDCFLSYFSTRKKISVRILKKETVNKNTNQHNSNLTQLMAA